MGNKNLEEDLSCPATVRKRCKAVSKRLDRLYSRLTALRASPSALIGQPERNLEARLLQAIAALEGKERALLVAPLDAKIKATMDAWDLLERVRKKMDATGSSTSCEPSGQQQEFNME